MHHLSQLCQWAPFINHTEFQCGVKRLPTTCASAKVVWSGISRLWLGVLDPSSWLHNKSDLKQAPFFFSQEMLPSDLWDQISTFSLTCHSLRDIFN